MHFLVLSAWADAGGDRLDRRHEEEKTLYRFVFFLSVTAVEPVTPSLGDMLSIMLCCAVAVLLAEKMPLSRWLAWLQSQKLDSARLAPGPVHRHT